MSNEITQELLDAIEKVRSRSLNEEKKIKKVKSVEITLDFVDEDIDLTTKNFKEYAKKNYKNLAIVKSVRPSKFADVEATLQFKTIKNYVNFYLIYSGEDEEEALGMLDQYGKINT